MAQSPAPEAQSPDVRYSERSRGLARLRREISLAQLRVVLDKELGRKTPDAVVTLSRIPLPPLSVLPDAPLRSRPSQGRPASGPDAGAGS